MFIEGVLPSSVIRDLTEEEMALYRAGTEQPDNRQPMFSWPRQIPLNGTGLFDTTTDCDTHTN
jgi:haloalkane dehalogenase